VAEIKRVFLRGNTHMLLYGFAQIVADVIRVNDWMKSTRTSVLDPMIEDFAAGVGPEGIHPNLNKLITKNEKRHYSSLKELFFEMKIL
jgi:hypothetical protein